MKKKKCFTSNICQEFIFPGFETLMLNKLETAICVTEFHPNTRAFEGKDITPAI